MRDLYPVLDDKIFEALSNLHTITIAKIVGVNEKSLECKPVINRVIKGRSEQLPVFEDVPPVFMRGGGSYTAHPVSEGDYCLLFITERCYDNWYVGIDFQSPPEMRMHDYSDGFALVGIGPLSSAITIPKVITQIGDTYASGDYEHDGNREQNGDYVLNGDQVINGDLSINGNLQVVGNIACTGTFTVPIAIIGGVSFGEHRHQYDWTESAGNSITEGPR